MPMVRKTLATALNFLKFSYESMNWVLVAIQILWKLTKITPERVPKISTWETFNLGRHQLVKFGWLFVSIINSYNMIWSSDRWIRKCWWLFRAGISNTIGILSVENFQVHISWPSTPWKSLKTSQTNKL
jgi:hypothetical protein